jgi:myosin heavy subunit
MEAIGNAKTVRNNNSSRFGKHFDIQFDEKGSILGAFTSIYLLEKPRITEHMKGERNYHIFYMLCKSGEAIRDPVFIKNWEKYKICSQPGTVAEVTSWNDNAEMKDMHAAYIKLGFSETQRSELYMLFSFCLQLGNVNFEDDDGGDGCMITTPEVLELASELMQVQPEDLGAAITSKTMGGGVIEVFIKPLEATGWRSWGSTSTGSGARRAASRCSSSPSSGRRRRPSPCSSTSTTSGSTSTRRRRRRC